MYLYLHLFISGKYWIIFVLY